MTTTDASRWRVAATHAESMLNAANHRCVQDVIDLVRARVCAPQLLAMDCSVDELFCEDAPRLSTSLLDLGTGPPKWSDLNRFPVRSCYRPGLCVLADGCVVAVSQKAVWRLDVQRNVWACLPQFSTLPSSPAVWRLEPAVVRLNDADVFVIRAGNLQVLRSGQSAWTQLAFQPWLSCYLASVACKDFSRLLTAGGIADGNTVLDVVHQFDPVADCWLSLASLPSPRHSLALSTLSDGQAIYAAGGSQLHPCFGNSPAGPSASLVRLDLRASGGWSELSPLLSARTGHKMIAVDEWTLGICGGEQSNLSSHFELYDSRADAWQTEQTWQLPPYFADPAVVQCNV